MGGDEPTAHLRAPSRPDAAIVYLLEMAVKPKHGNQGRFGAIKEWLRQRSCCVSSASLRSGYRIAALH